MRRRDVVILVALILLVITLTVAEKYAEQARESRIQRQEEAARRDWQDRIGKTLDTRWKDLSVQLRRTLDSMVTATVTSGVSPDSLAAVMSGLSFPAGSSSGSPGASTARASDSLAVVVSREYKSGLAALPTDLNAYEKRVAAAEVASMVRARFGLTTGRFDSLVSLPTQ